MQGHTSTRKIYTGNYSYIHLENGISVTKTKLNKIDYNSSKIAGRQSKSNPKNLKESWGTLKTLRNPKDSLKNPFRIPMEDWTKENLRRIMGLITGDIPGYNGHLKTSYV